MAPATVGDALWRLQRPDSVGRECHGGVAYAADVAPAVAQEDRSLAGSDREK